LRKVLEATATAVYSRSASPRTPTLSTTSSFGGKERPPGGR